MNIQELQDLLQTRPPAAIRRITGKSIRQLLRTRPRRNRPRKPAPYFRAELRRRQKKARDYPMDAARRRWLPTGQTLAVHFRDGHIDYVTATAPCTLGGLLQRMADDSGRSVVGYRLGITVGEADDGGGGSQ